MLSYIHVHGDFNPQRVTVTRVHGGLHLSRDIRGHLWDRAAPCWFCGGRRIAQRAEQRAAARQRTHKQFTQVRAAARCKTLLLLWWIYGGNERGGAWYTCPARPAYGDHKRMVAWVMSSFQPSNPLLRLPWASFYRLRGHHSGKIVITH